MNTSSVSNKSLKNPSHDHRKLALSEKSDTSRKTSNTMVQKKIKQTKSKTNNMVNFYPISTILSVKSEKLNSNVIKKIINPKEEKLRETIKSIIYENSSSNRIDPKRSLSYLSENNDVQIKFLENNKNVAPYDEQIKNYLKKNFDNKYLCGICFGIFREPMICYKCEKIFCKNCLRIQLDKKGKCCNCFNIIFFEQCKFYENDDYEAIYQQNLLNCVYNPVCKKICNINEIDQHMAECIFRELKCKYDKINLLNNSITNNLSSMSNLSLNKPNNSNSCCNNLNMKDSYCNEILEGNTIFNFNKLDFLEKGTDPLEKMHLSEYFEKNKKFKPAENFENISKCVGILAYSSKKNGKLGIKKGLNSTRDNEDFIQEKFNLNEIKDFKSRLSEFNGQMESLNSKIANTIIDLANITKISNDKMKIMINNY